ncbi:MAG TPA: hypothetical protein VFY69_07450 [Solirubrobacterales bacterium]|nr:hypothetical protein [Solirubrobacterales bacterium]
MLAAGLDTLRRPRLLAMLAALAVPALASIAIGDLAAHAEPPASGDETAQASSRNFEERLRMKITKKEGNRVAAKGRATGTVDGKVSFKLRMVSGSKAKASFYGRNSHGTLSGTGVARYRVDGAVSYYTGRITNLSGTGRYAGASSRGISLSGTVNRRLYSVKMTLTGRWDA